MNSVKMGEMEIKKLLLTMSVPIMISMLIQALYNIVDSMFVARISSDAFSAVSLCYPVQTIMVAVACGMGVGINAWMSRYLGLKNSREASLVAQHGILIALVCWAIFLLFGIFGSRWFLSLFTDKIQILDMGIIYLKICTTFSFGVFIQITFERIMQATGNAFYNMILQGVGALVNIILDPIFIFGFFGIPKMGVAGAALATVIGQCVAMAIGIWVTKKRINEINLKFHSFKISFDLLKQIMHLAIPAVFMQSIMSFMTVFINAILVPYSTVAVNVFSVYFKLQQFLFMAVLGMTNALVPIISYNYGAGKKDRIHDSIKYAILFTIVIMVTGTVVFECIPTQLLNLFDADRNMLLLGVDCLRITSLSFAFAGISLVLCSSFQALNFPYKSLAITALRQFVLLIPMVYILSSMFGIAFCWWSFVITEVICCVIAVIQYFRIKTVG